ncbi:MAG: ARMT1-like domain-containing protein [Gammaproteobacteria bacterium]
MKTYLDCYPCFVRHALDASRLAGASEKEQDRVMRRVLAELGRFDQGRSPPEMAYVVQQSVRHVTGQADPYREAKEASTREALSLYPELKRRVVEAVDPLETAVRLAIAGNVIDLGIAPEYDLSGTIERVLEEPFAVNDLDAFRAEVKAAKSLLYLADNAGETVFDRVLIETLRLPLIYVVKSGPILNDATRGDALEVGIGELATIVETGSDAPGTILDHCSEGFVHLFAEAELIIAKGQANYETLSDTAAPVFFLLQVKCGVTAKDLGVPVKSTVLKRAGKLECKLGPTLSGGPITVGQR